MNADHRRLYEHIHTHGTCSFVTDLIASTCWNQMIQCVHCVCRKNTFLLYTPKKKVSEDRKHEKCSKLLSACTGTEQADQVHRIISIIITTIKADESFSSVRRRVWCVGQPSNAPTVNAFSAFIIYFSN